MTSAELLNRIGFSDAKAATALQAGLASARELARRQRLGAFICHDHVDAIERLERLMRDLAAVKPELEVEGDD